MYFAGKLVYLIVRASNKLAVKGNKCDFSSVLLACDQFSASYFLYRSFR